MLSILSYSLEDTRRLGKIISHHLQKGDVLFLEGDLGTGKSELTRGIAMGLQIFSPITSPTFTILNVYDEGSFPLFHFDWYRIHDEEELFEIGIDDFLNGEGISVVEWPSKSSFHYLCIPHLSIHISYLTDTTRTIQIKPKNHFREIDLQRIYDEYFSI